jgi:hypothetical protein
MTQPRLLTIMGSGETTATMVAVHRAVFERFADRPLVVLLDTPYGFQENADELTERSLGYFHTSLPMADVEVASLRSVSTPAAARERALDTLRRAQVVFSGPGSPSYALRVWASTLVPAILADKLTGGGALTFASAASITLGRFSLPVYEIYKVGDDPHWLDGLDLLGAAGIPAAVVPHWDNAEGGTHDTSRCWLGMRRFEALRSRLPAGVGVLGIDEHTACLIDLTEGVLTVAGKGTVTLLRAEDAAVLEPGDTAPLALLGAAPSTGPAGAPAACTPPSLTLLEEGFRAAVEAGDTGAALDAILSLEDSHQSWDTEAAAAAHQSLLGMVTRFATITAGRRLDQVARVGAVEALLEVRTRARADGRWDDADAIRQALGLLSVEVRDTPDGTVWQPLAP